MSGKGADLIQLFLKNSLLSKRAKSYNLQTEQNKKCQNRNKILRQNDFGRSGDRIFVPISSVSRQRTQSGVSFQKQFIPRFVI